MKHSHQKWKSRGDYRRKAYVSRVLSFVLMVMSQQFRNVSSIQNALSEILIHHYLRKNQLFWNSPVRCIIKVVTLGDCFERGVYKIRFWKYIPMEILPTFIIVLSFLISPWLLGWKLWWQRISKNETEEYFLLRFSTLSLTLLKTIQIFWPDIYFFQSGIVCFCANMFSCEHDRLLIKSIAWWGDWALEVSAIHLHLLAPCKCLLQSQNCSYVYSTCSFRV